MHTGGCSPAVGPDPGQSKDDVLRILFYLSLEHRKVKARSQGCIRCKLPQPLLNKDWNGVWVKMLHEDLVKDSLGSFRKPFGISLFVMVRTQGALTYLRPESSRKPLKHRVFSGVSEQYRDFGTVASRLTLYRVLAVFLTLFGHKNGSNWRQLYLFANAAKTRTRAGDTRFGSTDCGHSPPDESCTSNWSPRSRN